MDREIKVEKCEYLVFWLWMNGFNLAHITIVTPFVPRKWFGIQFSNNRDKVNLLARFSC